MKKKLIWLLFAAIPFAMTACGNASDAASSDSSDTITAVASDTVEYGDVTLGNYKGLSAEKTVYEVTEDNINDQIESLKTDYVTYKDVDRASQSDDYVTVHMTATVGDETILDYSDEDYEICIGSEEFGTDFDEKLTGVSTGDQLDFSLSYDEDYPDDSFAGNTVDFSITVLTVTEEVLPELTDDFITNTLGYESYEAMTAELSSSLAAENDSNSEYELRENLIQQVIDASKITTYSQSLYDNYAASIEENYQSYADMFGYETTDEIYEMFGMTEDDVNQEILNQVYRTIVVHAISDQENLSISDTEYTEGLEKYTEENEYDSSDELLADYGEESIREWLLEDKVLDLIEENATITKVQGTAEAEEEEEV